MTKKLKILLIAVLGLIAVVCASLAAGCKFSLSVDEIKDMFGLSARVTYFLNLGSGNGGAFNDGLYVKDIYYKEGEIPINLGEISTESGSSDLKINSGYSFDGWYVVKTDENGNPMYADGTSYVEGDDYDSTKGLLYSTEYDFTKPLEKDEHVYICGGFVEDVKLKFRLLYEDEPFEFKVTVTDDEGKEVEKTVNEGEEIEGLSYNIPKKATGLDDITNIMSISGCTITGLFVSNDDTLNFSEMEFSQFTSWPIMYPDDGQDVYLYVKVLKGSWTLLKSISDVKSMFSRNTGYNYYLMNDIDGEVTDGEGNTTITQISNLAAFSGCLYGGKDGHTISNFIVTSTSQLRNDSKASMFGEIRDTAEFKNVTFENITVRFTVGGGVISKVDANVNFIANAIDENAKFTNVSISGSLEITLSNVDNSLITNTTENSWIFGDKDDANYNGITVPYATCTVFDTDGNIVQDEHGNDRYYTVGNNNNN